MSDRDLPYVPNERLADALWPYVMRTRRWFVFEPTKGHYETYMKMLLTWNSCAVSEESVAVAE